MLHTKFQDLRNFGSRRLFKVFLHIWAWRPSWSRDLDHLYKFLFPLLVICCVFPLNDFLTVFPIQMHRVAKFDLAIKKVKVNPGSSFI